MNYEMCIILLQKQHVALIISVISEFSGLEYYSSYVLWAHIYLELLSYALPFSLPNCSGVIFI